MSPSTTKKIKALALAIQQKGGKALYVGGYVRDSLLNIKSKDIDIEVYGLDHFDQLKEIAKNFGACNEVGKSFSVLKLKFKEGLEVDLSFPRLEEKTGPGHKGFTVTASGNLTYKEAAFRRDFTINSIAQDIITGEIIDPFNGQKDLKNQYLKHIGPKFAEDPLRVFRAAQFAARFNLTVDPKTIQLCQSLDVNELPKERIWEEWKKMVLKAKTPSIGLKILRETKVINMFPELKALIETPQDPEWHPEGDVWDHTLMVVDQMAQLKQGDEKKDLIFMLAALCHDLGKPLTTKMIDQRWRSPGHEQAGLKPTKSFLKRLTDEKEIIDQVGPLVCHHLKPMMLYKADQKDKVSDAAIRRLSLKVSIQDLVLLATADHFGRGTKDAKEKRYEAGKWLLKRAEACQVKDQAPEPLIMGRDLMKLGIKPGKKMGEWLKKAFEAQLDGQVQTKEEAIQWVARKIK